MSPHCSTPAKILIVDDHPMVRDGLAMRIAHEHDLAVCGEAEDTAEALQLVHDLHPDLVIVDIALKEGNGISLIEQILKCDTTVKTLVHSMYPDRMYAERAIRAGASGYINKQTARGTIIKAIRHVLAGNIYLDQEITNQIVRRRVGGGTGLEKTPVDSLSTRELEILTLIGHGHTTRAISTHLSLSIHTIETYRERLKHKLQLDDSAQLSRYAAQWDLENG
jgi:DNA-binding NarL/FixJ family response regulator